MRLNAVCNAAVAVTTTTIVYDNNRVPHHIGSFTFRNENVMRWGVTDLGCTAESPNTRQTCIHTLTQRRTKINRRTPKRREPILPTVFPSVVLLLACYLFFSRCLHAGAASRSPSFLATNLTHDKIFFWTNAAKFIWFFYLVILFYFVVCFFFRSSSSLSDSRNATQRNTTQFSCNFYLDAGVFHSSARFLAVYAGGTLLAGCLCVKLVIIINNLSSCAIVLWIYYTFISESVDRLAYYYYYYRHTGGCCSPVQTEGNRPVDWIISVLFTIVKCSNTNEFTHSMRKLQIKFNRKSTKSPTPERRQDTAVDAY